MTKRTANGVRSDGDEGCLPKAARTELAQNLPANRAKIYQQFGVHFRKTRFETRRKSCSRMCSDLARVLEVASIGRNICAMSSDLRMQRMALRDGFCANFASKSRADFARNSCKIVCRIRQRSAQRLRVGFQNIKNRAEHVCAAHDVFQKAARTELAPNLPANRAKIWRAR